MAKARRAARRILMPWLGRSIVGELKRDAEVLGLDEGDHGLEVIAVLAGDTHLLLLDRSLGLDLGVLDDAHDLLGLLHGNTILEGDALAQGAPRRRLRVLDGQRLEIDDATVELGLEDVEHGLELHVIGRGEDEVHLLLDDVVLRSLEVIASFDLPLGLIDGVGHFLHVHLARDVEAVFCRHDLSAYVSVARAGGYLMSRGTTAAPLGGVNAKRVSLRAGLRTTRLNDMVTVFWSWSYRTAWRTT